MALLRRLLTEFLLWNLAPGVFLFLYVHHFHVPYQAAPLHLLVMAVPWLGVALVRIGLYLFVPGPRLVRAISAALISALLCLIAGYYLLVLISLASWGHVISWPLIATYGAQASRLASIVQISLPLLLCGLVIGATLLALLIAAGLRRFDWVSLACDTLRRRLMGFVFCVSALIWLLSLYNFRDSSWWQAQEPLSMTFLKPEMPTFQHQLIDGVSADHLDQEEDRARAAYQVSPRAEHKNVILIVVDALRADHMGLYGYGRNTTPELSRLERERRLQKVAGVRASCSESLCGLLSVASSKYVHQFSLRSFTLQMVLRRYGYRIEMVLGGDHTNFYGLRRLYGAVDTYIDGSMTPGYYMNDDQLVIDHFKGHPAWDGVPVMLQFHLMSVHSMGRRHAESLRFSPSADYSLWRNASNEELRRTMINHYDNGVFQADAMVAQILELLAGKGYLSNAIVVITADHGEALGEHGVLKHTDGIYDALLRVPLILIPYGYQSAPLAHPEYPAQVDIAPTILRELGMPVPATWSGRPLQDRTPPPFIYFQQRADVGLADLRDPAGPWKYWVNLQSGQEFAFNLRADPKELDNQILRVPIDRRREWASRLPFKPGSQGEQQIK